MAPQGRLEKRASLWFESISVLTVIVSGQPTAIHQAIHQVHSFEEGIPGRAVAAQALVGEEAWRLVEGYWQCEGGAGIDKNPPRYL